MHWLHNSGKGAEAPSAPEGTPLVLDPPQPSIPEVPSEGNHISDLVRFR